jgi:hypothetical protein
LQKELLKERNHESRFLNSKEKVIFISKCEHVAHCTVIRGILRFRDPGEQTVLIHLRWPLKKSYHHRKGCRQDPTLALGRSHLVSRSLAGINRFLLNIAAANHFATEQKSSQESYENDMLYGFKRKETQNHKGLNFVDVVNQMSEKSKTDRKRSSAYARVEQFNIPFFLYFKYRQDRPKNSTLESVCPPMARNSRSCSVVVTNPSTDSSWISSTNTSDSYSSNSSYNSRRVLRNSPSHLWTNSSNPLFEVRPWHPTLESIR